jgi:segregation and condensation protein B
MEHLKSLIEALIFIADEPLSLSQLNGLFTSDEGKKEWGGQPPATKDVKEALVAIQEEYTSNERGLELCEVSGGYQFRTRKDFASWIHIYNKPQPTRLSTPALETLSIIAYRQPVTRPEIEDIRGVDSGGVMKSLLERRLIRIIGKKDEPGTPLIYSTSKEFLEVFGLKNLSDLPPLKDFEDLIQAGQGSDADQNSHQQIHIKDLITSEETLMEIEGEEQASLGGLDEKVKTLRSTDRDVSVAIEEKQQEESEEEVFPH